MDENYSLVTIDTIVLNSVTELALDLFVVKIKLPVEFKCARKMRKNEEGVTHYEGLMKS